MASGCGPAPPPTRPPPSDGVAPLSPEELHDLESTLLPALERHHLRLLAHGLRTLQAIAGRRDGPLPDRPAIAAWANSQEAIRADPAFIEAFLVQLEQLGATLERISRETPGGHEAPARHETPAGHEAPAGGETMTGGGNRASSGPLALALDDLKRWSLRQADQRLETPEGHP